MKDDEIARKATVPESSILAEVIKVSVKLDEMKREFGNELLTQREHVRLLTNRVDSIEGAIKRTSDESRRAMQSSSNLESHVKTTEQAMRVAVDKMGDRIGAVEVKVDSMSAEQTPLLRAIRDEQIARKAREQLAAEQKKEAIAEATRLARAVEATRKFRLKIVAAVGVIIVGAVPAVTSYFATKQANADSPRPAQIQADAGPVR